MRVENEIVLKGPDGANPLGFLCALGILRTLTLAWPDGDVRMAWQQERAFWRPVLRATSDLQNTDALIQAMHLKLLEMEWHSAFNFHDSQGTPWVTTRVAVEEYRHFSHEASQTASMSDRRWVDFAAALACDGITLKNDDSIVQDTEFRMLGGGRQRFMTTIRNLVKDVRPEHIKEAMLGPWRYIDNGDGNRNLRLDPVDDRRHAMRWTDPTVSTILIVDGKPKSAKIWMVLGANRLAIEAWPMFPVFPVRSDSVTTGFSRRWRSGPFFSWPLWECFLSLETTRSVLALPEIQSEQPSHANLSSRGIVGVFRASKIVVGEYKNFSSAQPV